MSRWRILGKSMNEPLKFNEAIARGESEGRKPHVLLGNGFSMGAHEEFEYGSLYEQARCAQLPPLAVELFEEYGTTNFEGVLRRLDNGIWLAKHYGLDGTDGLREMQDDYEAVKNALVEAIAEIHPAASTEFDEWKMDSARYFLEKFGTIFTTNYDLLVYWSLLSGDSEIAFEDGFGRRVSLGEDYLAFHGRKADEDKGALYFLHGALHLTTFGGEVRKLAWARTNARIINQVQMGLESKQYPLVVSEGKADEKAARIQGNGYLYRAFLELSEIEDELFIYGHSLSDEDAHIQEAIVDNIDLKTIYVGIHGDTNSYANRKLKERTNDLKNRRSEALRQRHTSEWPLAVRFYDSESAHVWNAV